MGAHVLDPHSQVTDVVAILWERLQLACAAFKQRQQLRAVPTGCDCFLRPLDESARRYLWSGSNWTGA